MPCQQVALGLACVLIRKGTPVPTDHLYTLIVRNCLGPKSLGNLLVQSKHSVTPCFLIYIHTTLQVPGSNALLFTAMKPKSEENFHTATMLFLLSA
jgi:hypothetical protein